MAAQNLIKAIREERLIHFKNYSGVLILREEDILFVKADGNYAIVTMYNGESEYIFERIGEIEKRMSSHTFMRAGKSIIINRKYLRQINVKKSTIQLATGKVSIDVDIPDNIIKEMKNSLPKI
jgi:DNA-binding LytR/AlgR family response regulator